MISFTTILSREEQNPGESGARLGFRLILSTENSNPPINTRKREDKRLRITPEKQVLYIREGRIDEFLVSQYCLQTQKLACESAAAANRGLPQLIQRAASYYSAGQFVYM